MSYSRWGGSEWYTFWHAQAEETENRDTAIFDICGVATFTAKQLREHLPACLDVVKKVQDGDLDELTGYIQDFLHDVDREYPIKEYTHESHSGEEKE